MPQVSIINSTKDYVTLRVPRSFMREFLDKQTHLSEAAALKILRAGMREYKQGKTKKLTSLKELRHGN